MEVILETAVEQQLNRIAAERGRPAEMLAREVIEQFVKHDEWFVAEVEKGIDSAKAGRLLTHEAVGDQIKSYLAEKKSRI